MLSFQISEDLYYFIEGGTSSSLYFPSGWDSLHTRTRPPPDRSDPRDSVYVYRVGKGSGDECEGIYRERLLRQE